jgi:hypothetical protein
MSDREREEEKRNIVGEAGERSFKLNVPFCRMSC